MSESEWLDWMATKIRPGKYNDHMVCSMTKAEWNRLFALARRGVDANGMKLNIDPEKFLAAVDREGDHEVSVGHLDNAETAALRLAMADKISAKQGEQRTICEACGNANLAHDRAAWTEDGTSYCPQCRPTEQGEKA